MCYAKMFPNPQKTIVDCFVVYFCGLIIEHSLILMEWHPCDLYLKRINALVLYILFWFFFTVAVTGACYQHFWTILEWIHLYNIILFCFSFPSLIIFI